LRVTSGVTIGDRCVIGANSVVIETYRGHDRPVSARRIGSATGSLDEINTIVYSETY